ncbi:MAG: hypothetical protein KAJ18_08820 [Candidatus Omnitrophica bacterium]|nr:hypothetical protein [Candidatus Omnitrophota bacterium]
MGTISRNIRDIDEDLYRKFRAACVEKNIKTGEAITEALTLWLVKEGKLEK